MPKLTAAENSKNYRKRIKQRTTSSPEPSEKKTPKSSTQRSREYRARESAKLSQFKNCLHSHVRADFNVIKVAKTSAERMREYRARRKAKLQEIDRSLGLNEPRSSQSKLQVGSKKVPNVKKIPKTSAERTREHRARQKAKLMGIDRTVDVINLNSSSCESTDIEMNKSVANLNVPIQAIIQVDSSEDDSEDTQHIYSPAEQIPEHWVRKDTNRTVGVFSPQPFSSSAKLQCDELRSIVVNTSADNFSASAQAKLAVNSTENDYTRPNYYQHTYSPISPEFEKLIFRNDCDQVSINTEIAQSNTKHRFPKDKEVRQKWLDAINWSNGRPKPNHYVCGVHFDSIDVTSALHGDTTAVPTIFNPELVKIKQETDISDPNLSTLSSDDVLDTEIVKVEIDDHSNAWDFESYEIINIPSAPDDEIEMPMPKRIKIENNSSDSSSEPQEAPKTANVIKNGEIEMPLPIKIENNSSDSSSDSSSELQEAPQNANVTKNGEIEMPLPIRIKIENNSSDSSSDLQGANQSTSIEMSEPKVTQEDLSKVSLKLVSVPSGHGSKMIVKAVAKSSEKQSNSSYDALVKPCQSKFPIYSAKSVLKVTKAPERQSIRIHVGKSLLKPQIKSPEDHSSSSFATEPEVKTLTKSSEYQTKPISAKIIDEGVVKSFAESPSNPTTSDAETDSLLLTPNSRLEEAETRDLLNYMLINRKEYLNLNKLPSNKSKFWEAAELSLKKQGVIRQSITKDVLCNKWNVLAETYRRLTQYEIDQDKFPFTKELKEILQGPVKGPNLHLEHDNKIMRPRFSSEPTSLTVNSSNSKVYNHYQWTENDTRAFLKCISKHKDDFVDWANGKQKNFWEKIEIALKEQDIMIKIATAEKLIEKWNVLMNTYRYFPSGEVNRSKFPFIEEMKEILLDSLKSHNHSISIGLASLCQPVKSPSEIDFESQMPLNYPTYMDKQSLNNKKDLSTSELKKIYLQKKIEGRELKNNLLKRLLSDSQSHNKPNEFRMIIKN